MTTTVVALETPSVAKDRKKADDKQVTFRLSAELHARLEAAADGLEVDNSSLLRMIIREHLPAYEARAEAIRAKERRD